MKIPRRARRAILIYIATIVVPIGALLWLGLQSFERQRQAVRTLTEEKIRTAIESEGRGAALDAFANRSHPIVDTFFVLEEGEVIEPALRAPAPRAVPSELVAAERLEISLGRPDLAAARYQSLIDRRVHTSLALHFLARSLTTLGRTTEAHAVWSRLARSFPDDRDSSGRPYGIVAALNAGETDGLFDRISAGRWQLSADMAEYFLRRLDASRRSPYLERFRLAREVQNGFQPGLLADGEVQSSKLGAHLLFYRATGPNRVEGFAASPAWMATLEASTHQRLQMENATSTSIAFHAGAMAVLLLVLSGGVVILHREASREARASEARSDFVNGIAHELKTPMSILRLYGETLIQQPDLTEPERRDLYRVISRESARLGRLVDQVLTFSRVERGDARYDLQILDPASVISSIVDDYSGWLEHAGFAVDRDLPESMPAVRMDPAAVSQAVVNLLDNAAKYSGSARQIAVRLGAMNGHVTFEVQDHGPGIPAEEQLRIFERFYRSAGETSRGGYGLGLFMVRHIMETHRGSVEVESSPGRGSTFRLKFPVAAT